MNYIIDLHCDTITTIQAGSAFDHENVEDHIDIPRLRRGNVGAQVFACFVSSVVPEKNAHAEALKMLDLIDHTCDQFPADLQKAFSAANVEDAVAQDKIAIIPAVENGHAIANDLKKLDVLRQKGTRYMTLTHSKNLDWAASSGEKSAPFDGLTPFGIKVLAAMEELHIIPDVSHVHESTFWAVIKQARGPVIASHSNAMTVCRSPRNLTDDQVKAIAASGGMIGINFYPGFLNTTYARVQMERGGDLFAGFDTIEKEHWSDPPRKKTAMREMERQFTARMHDIRVDRTAIIDHIAYIIDLVGEDYVGFGSDFDGVPALPADVSGSDVYPGLLNLMRGRGFSESTIDKVCSGNFLRVLRAAGA